MNTASPVVPFSRIPKFDEYKGKQWKIYFLNQIFLNAYYLVDKSQFYFGETFYK